MQGQLSEEEVREGALHIRLVKDRMQIVDVYHDWHL